MTAPIASPGQGQRFAHAELQQGLAGFCGLWRRLRARSAAIGLMDPQRNQPSLH
jgi:hypothetical protein